MGVELKQRLPIISSTLMLSRSCDMWSATDGRCVKRAITRRILKKVALMSDPPPPCRVIDSGDSHRRGNLLYTRGDFYVKGVRVFCGE